MSAPYGQDHPGTPPPKRRRNRSWWLSALWVVLLYIAYHVGLVAGASYWSLATRTGGMGPFGLMLVCTVLVHAAGLAWLSFKAFEVLRDETRWHE